MALAAPAAPAAAPAAPPAPPYLIFLAFSSAGADGADEADVRHQPSAQVRIRSPGLRRPPPGPCAPLRRPQAEDELSEKQLSVVSASLCVPSSLLSTCAGPAGPRVHVQPGLLLG